MQEPSRSIPTYDNNVVFKDYILKPGDKLLINVYSTDETMTQLFNNSANSNTYGDNDLYTYTIGENGAIKFPFVGEITLADQTTRQAGHAIADSLTKLVANDKEKIFVDVKMANRYFSIIGIQSGRYAITKEKMTIFEGLALAGDITEFGDRANIKIVREVDGVTKIKKIDIRSATLINSEYYYIEPDDIIYIRPIRGRAFGINSASSALIVASSTISFGILIYTIVQQSINRAKK